MLLIYGWTISKVVRWGGGGWGGGGWEEGEVPKKYSCKERSYENKSMQAK